MWNISSRTLPKLGEEILIFDRSDAVEDEPLSIPVRTVIGLALEEGRAVLTLKGGFVNPHENCCDHVIETWVASNTILWALFRPND